MAMAADLRLLQNRHHFLFPRCAYIGPEDLVRNAPCMRVPIMRRAHEAIHCPNGLYLPPSMPSHRELRAFEETHEENECLHRVKRYAVVSVFNLSRENLYPDFKHRCANVLVQRPTLAYLRSHYIPNPNANIAFWVEQLEMLHAEGNCTCTLQPSLASVPNPALAFNAKAA